MQHGARAGLCAELCAQCNIIKCTVQANLKRRELVAIMFAMHVFERMHSLYFHTNTHTHYKSGYHRFRWQVISAQFKHETRSAGDAGRR